MNDEIVIRITKKRFGGEFSHWEVDVESETADVFLAGTAPTFWGVIDMATDYLWEEGQDSEWFKDDANNR